MIDLFCLVADRNMHAALDGMLQRAPALGIREIRFDIKPHPNRDPGCFHQWSDLLPGFRGQARHALVVLDRAWDGAPANDAAVLEDRLEKDFARAGLDTWARAVVIDPELEAWVFSRSPHVETILGWTGQPTRLRDALSAQGRWPAAAAKPPDPKGAVEWALRQSRIPRSSSLYRQLAERVSLDQCSDRSFLRLRQLLAAWFGKPA